MSGRVIGERRSIRSVIISVFDWYPKSYPLEERKLLRKLDLCILIFGSISFFCRFLGQQNITNAFVSEMREDLGAWGNELNYYKMAYNTAYVLGQIPLMTLQTKPKIAPYLLPVLQIFWGIIAFCQAKVTQNYHLYILRAITGFLEASSFGGTHLILGSWYKHEELFKRAGVWFMGNSLGSMFSGYFAAAINKNLNGAMGMAGWRWIFIIQGVITVPTTFLGFAFWPGLPSSPRRWFFSEEEHAIASRRIHHVENEGITWKTFKFTVCRPMFWIAVPCYIMLVQAHYWTGYMALWLRAAGYAGSLVTILPTFIDLLRALSSWLGTTLAGVLSVASLFSFQFSLVFFAIICLAVWFIPDGLKFLAFYLGGFSGMASPILYSFVNTTLKESYGERGLVISSMMTLGFCTQIWVPLFTFPTVQAPRFPNGYPAAAVFEFAMWAILMFGIWYMKRWKARNPDWVPEDERQGVVGAGADSEEGPSTSTKEGSIGDDERYIVSPLDDPERFQRRGEGVVRETKRGQAPLAPGTNDQTPASFDFGEREAVRR